MRGIERLVRYNWLLLVFIFPLLVLAQPQIQDSVLNSKIKFGIELILNQKYDESDSHFAQIEIDYPNSPLGDIYFAASKIARATDYFIPFENDLIENKLETAIDKSEDLLDDNDNLWNNYFCALAYSYSAYYYNIQEDYFTAFQNGFESINYFNKCLEIEPNFYEAYIAQGTFLYWKGRLSSLVSWLPFVEDNRLEAVKILQSAVHNSSYNYHLAVLSLIWIYINLEDYQNAVEQAESILKIYPENRSFLWGEVSAYMYIDKKKSLELLEKIEHSLLNDNALSDCAYLVLEHKKAMILGELNETAKAIEICDRVIKKLSNKELDSCSEYERLAKLKELKDSFKR